MPKFLRTLAPTALVVATLVGLSGCSVLEDWGLLPATTDAVDEVIPAEETPVPAEGAAPPVESGFVVPGCDGLFSEGQTRALVDQARVNQGDTSLGDYGYGTTNTELVDLLRNVRADLRISCTWYLPASESVSVTSVSVLTPEDEATVTSLLGTSGATAQSRDGGVLWSIDSTTFDESAEYIATEAHFLVPVPCPSSLAETSCTAWITTNYAFGKAETLTLDAASHLGAIIG
jgi:hypothetical protein